jgi:hypothetical protein
MSTTDKSAAGDEATEASSVADADYDRFYYRNYLSVDTSIAYERSEHWLGFFGFIAERIVSDIGPASALDAGCAMGFLVESLRDRGVDAFGIDVSTYALEQVRRDVRPYCSRASVIEPFPRRYNLITCIETLEHLTPLDAERAVVNICAHTDDVLFSSTPNHFKEVTHLNVRPPEYWAELFARCGLHRDVDYEPSSYIAPWAVRFRRRKDPPARIAGDYERLLWRLRQENRDLRELSHERQSELARAVERLQAVETELSTMRATASWRVARRISRMADRLLPLGSRRRAVVRRLVPSNPPDGRA